MDNGLVSTVATLWGVKRRCDVWPRRPRSISGVRLSFVGALYACGACAPRVLFVQQRQQSHSIPLLGRYLWFQILRTASLTHGATSQSSCQCLGPKPHTVHALALRCPGPEPASVLSVTQGAVHSVQVQSKCSAEAQHSVLSALSAKRTEC